MANEARWTSGCGLPEYLKLAQQLLMYVKTDVLLSMSESKPSYYKGWRDNICMHPTYSLK